MSEILHPSAKTFPPKPGGHGRGAVYICPVCGNKFVRTLPEQSKCLTCLEKENNSEKM